MVDRRFWVADGRQADFEAVFGRSGIWQDFLGKFVGFAETEVKCESVAEQRYRVLDYWWSHREFEVFRTKFAAEYEKFNSLVLAEGLVERFELVGTYYDDRSDGDELVSEKG